MGREIRSVCPFLKYVHMNDTSTVKPRYLEFQGICVFSSRYPRFEIEISASAKRYQPQPSERGVGDNLLNAHAHSASVSDCTKECRMINSSYYFMNNAFRFMSNVVFLGYTCIYP